MDRREKEEKVDEVIEELGISHVANTLVRMHLAVHVYSSVVFMKFYCTVATVFIVNNYCF